MIGDDERGHQVDGREAQGRREGGSQAGHLTGS